MSKKPTKKSDLGKRWLEPRKGKIVPSPPEYHLIVTEGTKTEPLYFEGLKQVINNKYKGKIEIQIEGEGKNTLSLLKKAEEHVRNNLNPIKHVWLVYD